MPGQESCDGAKPNDGATDWVPAPPPPYVLPEPPGMSGAMSTSRVEDLLSKVTAKRHITLRRAFLDVAGPFPVAGPASWANDWHTVRPCPFPHLHEGLDIFAVEGTPVVATVSGRLTEQISDDVTGLGLQLSGPHGMEYLYAHLSAFAEGTVLDRWVKQGQVIGFVGNTGDAVGASPHLHLETQPGGIPMPPKPLVDRWLLQEERAASAMLTGRTRPPTDLAWSTRPLPDDSVTLVGAIPPRPAPERGAETLIGLRRVSAVSSESPTAPIGFLAAMGALLALSFLFRRWPRPPSGNEQPDALAWSDPRAPLARSD